MEDFNVIIDGREIHCARVYVKFIEPVERTDYTELKKLADLNWTPKEISGTMYIDKEDPNYQRMCEFFESLRNK